MAGRTNESGWEPVESKLFEPGPMPVLLLGLAGTLAFLGEVTMFIHHRQCLHKHDDDKCGGINNGGTFFQFILIAIFFGCVFGFVKQVKMNLRSRSVSTAYMQTGYYDEDGREEI